MFLSDDPRGLVNRLCFRRFLALDALPVAPALPVAFLLAALAGSVSAALSTATTSALPPGRPPRNIAGALAADETSVHILSADTAAAGISDASAGLPLDFCAVL
jgi:hypothetical protein